MELENNEIRVDGIVENNEIQVYGIVKNIIKGTNQPGKYRRSL